MKKIVLSFLSFAVLALMVSCDKDDTTAGISRITYFPDFVISNGEQTDLVPLGSAYEEPTATATEGGESLPVETEVSGRYTGASAFDVNVADEYSWSFSAINSDGFPGSASKAAIVFATGDFVTSIEGLYVMAVNRVAPPESHSGLEYAMITKIGDDTYEISHAHGGFYSDGRGYGDGYRFGGMTIKVVDLAANNFQILTQGLAASWAGNGPTEVTAAVVDAAARTISWDATWLGYVFQVTYTQVQP